MALGLLLPCVCAAKDGGLRQSGYVLDSDSRLPVRQARVTIVGDLSFAPEITDDKGFFLLRFVSMVTPGQVVRVRVEKAGYVPFDERFSVSQDLPQQFLLTRLPSDIKPDKRGTAKAHKEHQGFGPVFHESAVQYTVSVGGKHGMTQFLDPAQFKDGSRVGIARVETSKVDAFVEGGRFFADVVIAGPEGEEKVTLLHNVLRVSPYGWDWNYNERALEVVDENLVPVLQVIFRTQFNIDVFAAFPSGVPGLYRLVQNGSGFRALQPICQYSQQPIFKYPSWRYHGIYSDTKAERLVLPDSERANVIVTGAKVTKFESGDYGKLQVEFANGGKTPALNLGAFTAIGSATPPDTLSNDDFLLADTQPVLQNTTLPPGKTGTSGVQTKLPLDDERLLKISSQREVLYIWGTLHYDDIGKMCHRTRFCFRMTPGLQFAKCEQYNSSD